MVSRWGRQVPIMEFDSEEGAAKLSEYVKDKHGQVDYAVSCIGGWWQGGARGSSLSHHVGTVVEPTLAIRVGTPGCG